MRFLSLLALVPALAFAAPTIDSSTATDSASAATTIAVNRDSGYASGKLGIICIAADLTDAVGDEFSTPSGWTKIDEHSPGGSVDTGIAAYWRALNGSDPATETITWTTAAEATARYIVISNADTSSPIDVVGTPVSVNNNTSHVVSEVTTTVNDTLVLACLSGDGSDMAPGSVAGTGWTEFTDDQYGAGGAADDVWLYIAEKDQATAGLTDDATVTSTGSDGSASFQFAIAPAAASSSAAVQRRRL